MYLSESNKYNVAYYLNNISGNVLVKISDEDIVDASANKGKLSITAKKTGKSKITLIVKDGGVEYSSTLNVEVKENRPTTTTTTKKGKQL